MYTWNITTQSGQHLDISDIQDIGIKAGPISKVLALRDNKPAIVIYEDANLECCKLVISDLRTKLPLLGVIFTNPVS